MRTTSKLAGIKPRLNAVMRDATSSSGAKITLTDDDIVYGSMVLRSGTSDSGDITIGAAIIGSCNFSLWNDDKRFDGWNWTNTAVDVAFEYGEGEDVEKVNVGSFLVVSHKESGNTISVQCLDWLKLYDEHSIYECNISWPIDAVDLIKIISDFGVDNVRLEGLDGLEGVMLDDPGDDQMSNRDVIAYVAQCLGRFVTMSRYSMRFGWYDFNNAHDAGTTFSHELRTNNLTVTGVKVHTDDEKATETRGSEGYMIDIANNPFITKSNISTVADRIAGSVVGMSFRPGDFTISATPAIEAGDVLLIDTYDKKAIKTIASNVTYKPSSVKETFTADAPSADGDLQIKKSEYVRKVIRDELNNPNSALSKAISGTGAGGRAPDVAYKDTRPSDWLVMPEPDDDEIYLLYSSYDGITSPVNISVNTADAASDVTFSIWTTYGASFVPKYIETIPGGGLSSKTFSYNITDDLLGDLTADNQRQCIIKIKSIGITNISYENQKHADGSVSNADLIEFCGKATSIEYLPSMPIRTKYFTLRGSNNITSFAFNAYKSLMVIRELDTSKATSFTFIQCYNLISLPILDLSSQSSSLNQSFYQCYSLEYVGIKNLKNTLSTTQLFTNCYNLLSVSRVEFDNISNASNMFRYCGKLSVVDDINLDSAKNTSYMFANCYTLSKIGNISMPASTNTSYMFQNCYNLRRIGAISSELSANMSYMFANCYALEEITVDGTSATNMNYIFSNCTALSSVKIKNISGDVTFSSAFANCNNLRHVIFENVDGWNGSDISITSSTFDNKAAIALFESLPTITATHTINLNGLGLTDEEKAIATNKGWAVK